MKKTLTNNENGSQVRLTFCRYMHTRYDMPIQTAYGKFRRWLVKEWEMKGIDACIHGFALDYDGLPELFYTACTTRKQFCRYMRQRWSMGERTALNRFRRWDFEEWEVRGLESVWQEFLQSEEYAKALELQKRGVSRVRGRMKDKV